jgi:dTDP-N-acetylfucosamine:lipid II N-acetylfucosaminyltransferase
MIAHLFSDNPKFIYPFVDLIQKQFNIKEHIFFIFTETQPPPVGKARLIKVKTAFDLLKMALLLNRAKCIVLHGMFFSNETLFLLNSQPWLRKRMFWFMYGGDFYFPDRQPTIRRRLIKKVGNLVSSVPGDFDYAQKHYRTQGVTWDCLGYTTNIFVAPPEHPQPRENGNLRILVGNSATPTNHHCRVFEMIKERSTESLEVLCPLSYGDPAYAEEVVDYGRRLFGEAFKPLRKFVPLVEYQCLLNSVDIAIFDNNRQQALGNIISILGMGKTLYLRPETTVFRMLREKGFYVCELDSFTTRVLPREKSAHNINHTKHEFSEAKLVSQLNQIFLASRRRCRTGNLKSGSAGSNSAG